VIEDGRSGVDGGWEREACSAGAAGVFAACVGGTAAGCERVGGALAGRLVVGGLAAGGDRYAAGALAAWPVVGGLAAGGVRRGVGERRSRARACGLRRAAGRAAGCLTGVFCFGGLAGVSLTGGRVEAAGRAGAVGELGAGRRTGWCSVLAGEAWSATMVTATATATATAAAASSEPAASAHPLNHAVSSASGRSSLPRGWPAAARRGGESDHADPGAPDRRSGANAIAGERTLGRRKRSSDHVDGTGQVTVGLAAMAPAASISIPPTGGSQLSVTVGCSIANTDLCPIDSGGALIALF
jgi:hypothetical protein